MKKDYVKHKTWFKIKDIYLTFIYFESNILEAPSNAQ